MGQKTNIRCLNCGFNLEKYNSLYYCHKCNKFTTRLSNYPILETDFRVYQLTSSQVSFALKLYQLDILKIIDILERCKINYYSELLKSFIIKMDKSYNEETNFDRKLPRIHLREETDGHDKSLI